MLVLSKEAQTMAKAKVVILTPSKLKKIVKAFAAILHASKPPQPSEAETQPGRTKTPQPQQVV